MLVAAAAIRHAQPASPLSGSKFWAQKAAASAVYDVVLAGDSRVYRGLSPETIENSTRGLRCLNFGFSSAGLTEEYLQAATAKFDPTAEKKVLVVGITAWSFTEDAAKNEHWRSAKALAWAPRTFGNLLRDARHLFDPVLKTDIESLQLALQGRPAGASQETYHLNGWVETNSALIQPLQALASYRTSLAQYKPSHERMESAMACLREIRARGVDIIAFRPPTTSEMDALEDEASFDADQCAEQIRALGGIWIDIPRTGWTSYDGSHLTGDESRRLSQKVGEAIAEKALR